jgi:hypothetical protein
MPKKFQFAYLFPSIHFGLWLIGVPWITGHGLGETGWLGVVLGILDFPASLIIMMLVWVLPERVGLVGFGILGTLWWYYLGRKADERRATHRS